MLPNLQLGPLNLQVPGLLLILAVWFGLSLAEKFAPRKGLNADMLYNLVFYALIAGLIGARLSYAAAHLSIYTASPLSLVALTPDTLDPWGGLAVALLTALIYGQRAKLELWNTLDALTPFFAVMMIGIQAANAASGAAFGMPTTLPWGIHLWGDVRHPTQLYGLIFALATLILLSPKLMPSLPPGALFLRFIAVTAGWLLFVEGFRGDSLIFGDGLRALQLAAWLALAAALYGLDTLSKKENTHG